MLKSYEAIYENGQLRWLSEQPSTTSARVIVTVVEEVKHPTKRRTFPAAMVGKVEILGDIVGPVVDEQDWECLN